MKTLPIKKQFAPFYRTSASRIELLQVPPLQFLMISGAIEKGSEPGKSPGFAAATQALYSLAYTLKFMIKKRKTNAFDYPVMPLEGLWGVTDGRFDIGVKDNWDYTLMILTPEEVKSKDFKEALKLASEKKGDELPLRSVRLGKFKEGLCVQATHFGPYATEPATIERMQAFMAENGLADNVGPKGRHHEIYLSDPRRTSAAKMKTLLRHPVTRKR